MPSFCLVVRCETTGVERAHISGRRTERGESGFGLASLSSARPASAAARPCVRACGAGHRGREFVFNRCRATLCCGERERHSRLQQASVEGNGGERARMLPPCVCVVGVAQVKIPRQQNGHLFLELSILSEIQSSSNHLGRGYIH